MKGFFRNGLGLLILSLFLLSFLSLGACGGRMGTYADKVQPVSDHFDGTRYLNPGSPSKEGEGPKRGVFGWIWQWMAGNDWPEFSDLPPGPRTERDPPDYPGRPLHLPGPNGRAQPSLRRRSKTSRKIVGEVSESRLVAQVENRTVIAVL